MLVPPLTTILDETRQEALSIHYTISLFSILLMDPALTIEKAVQVTPNKFYNLSNMHK